MSDAAALMGTALHMVMQKWFAIMFPDAFYGNWKCIYCSTQEKKVVKKLKTIQVNPLLGKHLTGELKDFYSLKAWPYRIIYEVNKKKRRVEVNKIVHRQGAYKN